MIVDPSFRRYRTADDAGESRGSVGISVCMARVPSHLRSLHGIRDISIRQVIRTNVMQERHDELEAWNVLESELLIERWWMRLRVDRVELPNGEIIPEFHVVEYPHWVLVIAQDDENRLLFVDQYRHGVGRTSLEFPAGMLEPEEDPMEAAGRELQEETGFKAASLREIGTWAADPSRQSDRVFAYSAADVHEAGSPDPDATEELVVRRLTVDQTEQAIADGRLMHGLHVAAFYRALRLGMIRTNRDHE